VAMSKPQVHTHTHTHTHILEKALPHDINRKTEEEERGPWRRLWDRGLNTLGRSLLRVGDVWGEEEELAV